MKLGLHPSRQGIALIIVMIAVVTLSIMVGGFAYSMKVETTLARNSSMDSEMEWMGRSGIELAKWALCQPKTSGIQYDALNQEWAGGTGDTNRLPLPEGNTLEDYWLDQRHTRRISVKIEDLERKWNINTMKTLKAMPIPNAPDVLGQALFLYAGLDAAEKDTVENAILAWMDPSTTGIRDTGDSYYMSLDPPYRAKKGPLDDITELMMIRYITPPMFYGTGRSAQYSRGPTHQPGLGRSALDEPTYPVGLVDLFTTLSSGKVNINTASAEVLQCLPGLDDGPVQAIIAHRLGPEDPSEPTPFKHPFVGPGDLMAVAQTAPELQPLLPVLQQYWGLLFTGVSTTFDVRVEASIGGYKRTYHGVVRRQGNNAQTLFMYWD